MKKEILVFLSLGIITYLIGPVAAAGICSDDETIMRLSSTTNAHGALWNNSYPVKICYNDFFSTPYGGPAYHDCNTDNFVLKLSSVSNAHAADKNSTIYQIPVCYGGLSACAIKPSCDNSTGEAAILYTSGLTNAHLSIYPSAGYLPLCCKGLGVAIPPSVGPSACYELDKDSCINENGAIAENDPACNSEDKSLCKCSWNEGQSKCLTEWAVIVPEQPLCEYKCVIESGEKTECSGGSKILSLTARLESAGTSCSPGSVSSESLGCKSGSATVACGAIEANLPFFGMWNFFASLAMVVMVYMVSSWYRKNKIYKRSS